MKTCTKCRENKESAAFRPHKAYRDGLRSWCRLCEHRYNNERANRDKPDLAAKMRGFHLKRTYGLSSEQYQAMYNEQRGKCALCFSSQPVLCVDHDHSSGKNRLLLCKRCNHALGLFLESPAVMRRAALYVEKYGA